MAHRPIMRARATVAETAWCAHVWALRIESTTRRRAEFRSKMTASACSGIRYNRVPEPLPRLKAPCNVATACSNSIATNLSLSISSTSFQSSCARLPNRAGLMLTRRNVRRRQCKFRYLEFQLDQILHGLAYSLQRQLRVLGDLEVAGEAGSRPRRSPCAGVPSAACRPWRRPVPSRAVPVTTGRGRRRAAWSSARLRRNNHVPCSHGRSLRPPSGCSTSADRAGLRFRSAGREDNAQPPLAVLMAFSDVRQAQHALMGCCGLFLHAPGFVAVAGEQGVNAARLDAPREWVIF